MASPSSIDVSMADLSKEISTKVDELTQLLQSNSSALPKLGADGPSDYPANGSIYKARHAIIDACSTLINLAVGPRDFMFSQCVNLKAESFIFGALQHFGIFAAVPSPPASISYVDLSKKIGLSQEITERILKHAITSRIFYETQQGMVAHTANSLVVRQSKQLDAWLGTLREEMEPAMLKIEASLEKWGDSGKINETAVNLALGKKPEDTFWSILDNDETPGQGKGWKMKRFGISMGGLRNPKPDPTCFSNVLFDWESLGEATVVDVGGGAGLLSIEIATFHQKLNFIVQDQPNQESVFKSTLPADLESRVSFQVHDFFTPQPVKGADIYILSTILHDWPDESSINILRQLVPAMKATSRILLFEQLIGEPDEVSNAQMKYSRSLDLLMLALFNAKERTRDQWRTLMKATDERLEVKNFVRPSVGGSRALIEVGFREL